MKKLLLLIPVALFCLAIVFILVLSPKKALLSPLAEYQPDLTPQISKKINSFLSLDYRSSRTLANLDNIPRYLVYNLQTRRVYLSKNQKERVSPASFTKLLTAQVALDLTPPNQLLTATVKSVSRVPTVLGLKPGEQLSLIDLLRGAIVTSANDAASTIAETVATQNGLALDSYLNLMNKKAGLLGMNDSHFATPDGLDDPNQFTNLEDIAKLVDNTLINYPDITSLASTDRQDILPSQTHGKYYLPNWNGLLNVHPDVNGLKIAYTETAGYGTIVTATHGTKKFVVILSGADSIIERDLAAAALLDYAYIEERISPLNISRTRLKRRYQQWSDLTKQIRLELDQLKQK